VARTGRRLSQLDDGDRLYPRFALWDVRDVEGHVRATLEAALRAKNARLKRPVKNQFVGRLVLLCWRLSGLEEDGRTPRLEHHAEIHVVGRPKAVELGPYGNELSVQVAVARWRQQHLPPGVLSFVGYRAERWKSAYDPRRGLAFSTYSRRIMTPRVIDCFREELGDNRYGDRPLELSLDQLIEEWERDGSGASESFLDHNGPGSRGDFIDDLNRHAYYDPFSHMEYGAAADQVQGGEHVAAAR
jgi:hypothetical protein